MRISVEVQLISFLYALAFGAVTGVLYDAFRIIRVAFPIGRAAVFVEDMVFLFAAGILNFIFFLELNSGEIRVFILLGTIAGFVIYYFTVGMLIIKSAKLIVKIFRMIFGFVFGIIFAPIKKICSFLYKIIKKINGISRKRQKKATKRFNSLKKKYKIYLYKFKRKREKKCGDINDKKKKQNNSNGNVLRNYGHFDHFNDRFR